MELVLFSHHFLLQLHLKEPLPVAPVCFNLPAFTNDRVMKAPVRGTRKMKQPKKMRARAHSTFIYRAIKEGGSDGTGRVSLAGQCGCPKRILLQVVGLEASRLSKTNRHRIITPQEIHMAVTLVKRRLTSRPAA